VQDATEFEFVVHPELEQIPAPSAEELDSYRWLRDGNEMRAGIAPRDGGPARQTEVVPS
jgi:hypothetical protein